MWPRTTEVPLGARTGDLSYLADDARHIAEKPYYLSISLEPGMEHLRTNMLFDSTTVVLSNVRQVVNQFSLDEHGLEFVELGDIAGAGDLGTDDVMADVQMEAITLVKQRLQAEHCQCYDYRVTIPDSG
jgi:hypothetical protein